VVALVLGCASGRPRYAPSPERLEETLRTTVGSCAVEGDELRCAGSSGANLGVEVRDTGPVGYPVLLAALADPDPLVRSVAAFGLDRAWRCCRERVDGALEPAATAALRAKARELPVHDRRHLVRFLVTASLPHAEQDARAWVQAEPDLQARILGWSVLAGSGQVDALQALREAVERHPDRLAPRWGFAGLAAVELTGEAREEACAWAKDHLSTPHGRKGNVVAGRVVARDCDDGPSFLVQRALDAAEAGRLRPWDHLEIVESSCDDRRTPAVPSSCPALRAAFEDVAVDSGAVDKLRTEALIGLAISFGDDRTVALLDQLEASNPEITGSARRRLHRR
jgi:hypothetical protein